MMATNSSLPPGSKYYPATSPQESIGIILLHAYTGSPRDVNLLSRTLNRRGYGVMAPLFKGHGSQEPQEILNQGMSVWSQDVAEAVDFMRQEAYGDLFIFGLSLGGILAAQALVDQPQLFAGGGSFNSPIHAIGDNHLLQAFTHYVEDHYRRRKEVLTKDRRLAYQNDHLQQMRAINQWSQALEAQLNQLQRPYFIAQSGRDELIPVEAGFNLFDRLRSQGRTVQFNYFPDNSHVITVNLNRLAFEEALIGFIQQYSQH